MAVPQEKPGSDGSKRMYGPPAVGKILYLKIRLGAAVLAAMVGCVILSDIRATAQEDRPQITPGERRAPRKKDADPRALAVLQLGASGKASLVPIAILVNGKFWDAGAYKAAPVPMALESGTVYEAEKTGSSLGLFTVATALHANAVNAPMPWLGTGTWKPLGSEPEKIPLRAEKAPVGLDTSDGPPRLTKNTTANSAPAAAPPANAGPASTPSSSSSAPSSSAPSASSGDGPPRLSRPDSSQVPASTSSATPNPNSTPSQGDAKGQTGSGASGSNQTSTSQGGSSTPEASTKPESKTDSSKQADSSKPSDHSSTSASDSGADSANRPRLRRGKPAESFADEDVPGYSKLSPALSNNTKATGEKTAGAKAAKAAPVEQVQLIPAISDSGGPNPHSYGFEWLKGEEGERKEQLITMAKEQVNAYLTARAKATVTPKTAAQTTRRAPAKKPEPVLSNVQMTAYDLWSSNQPIVVFSAQAQMPPQTGWVASPEGQSPPTAPDMQYSVVIVAYPDTYNNFHKLYVGVTDRFHLDLTPRLELIDAVDADGDGRGELLFREVSDNGSGWVIYRATADKLWKMYDSLNPE
jgi:hypothetical protein